MKLKSLSLHRLPGFKHRGFHLKDISSKVNIVIGPNASGKTSICLAIEKLLWPNKKKDFIPSSIGSEWVCQETSFHLSVEDGARTISREGSEYIDRLPEEHFSSCFHMSLDDLYNGTDDAFAYKISQEIAGGYDIELARKKLTPSTSVRTAVKEWKIAKEKFDCYLKLQKNTQKEKLYLTELQLSIDKSKASRDRSILLEKIIQAKILQNKISDKQKLLNQYPQQLLENKISAQDWTTFQQLQRNKKELEIQIAEIKFKEMELEAQFARWKDVSVDENELDIQATRIQRMQRIYDQQQHQLVPALKVCSLELDYYLNFFAIDATASLESLRAEDLDELDDVWVDLENVKSKIVGIKELILLNDPQEFRPSNEIRTELKELYEIAYDHHKKWIYFWIFLCIAGITSVVMAGFLEGKQLILSITPFLPFIYLAMSLKKRQLPEIVTQIHALGDALAKSQLAEMQLEEKRKLHSKLAIEIHAQNALEEALETKSKEFGMLLTFKCSRYRFAEYYKHLIKRWMDHKLVSIELQESEDLLAHEWTEWRQFALLFSEDAVCDIDELNATLERMKNKMSKCEELKQTGALHQKIEKKLEDIHAQMDALLIKTGCHPSPSLLQELHVKLAEYEELKQELKTLKVNFAHMNYELDAHHQTKIQEPLERLLNEKIEEEEKAKAFGQLCESMGRLKNNIETMESSIEGQQLLSEKNTKFNETKKAARILAEKELLDFLIDETQKEFKLKCQPIVLREAAEWFKNFTQNSFILETPKNLHRENVAFEAIQSSTRERKSLSQLSRGTRIQLLIAVRLAFAMHSNQEKVHLPILLDEVLSNTDPERCGAMIDVLNTFVKQDRQVFYFTSNPQDFYQWQQKNQETHLIDLSEIQKKQAFAQSPLPLINHPLGLPKPKGSCVDLYGFDLKIPALNLSEPFESIPSYYLADSAEQLYRLLTHGIKNLGNSVAMESEALDKILPHLGSLISKKHALLKQFYFLKQQGRGKPLTKACFEEVGIAKKYHENFWSLAQDLSLDAKKFIKSLEIKEDPRAKGPQKHTLLDLKEFFIKKEYLDEKAVLDDDEIRRSLIDFTHEEPLYNLLEKVLLHSKKI